MQSNMTLEQHICHNAYMFLFTGNRNLVGVCFQFIVFIYRAVCSIRMSSTYYKRIRFFFCSLCSYPHSTWVVLSSVLLTFSLFVSLIVVFLWVFFHPSFSLSLWISHSWIYLISGTLFLNFSLKLVLCTHMPSFIIAPLFLSHKMI